MSHLLKKLAPITPPPMASLKEFLEDRKHQAELGALFEAAGVECMNGIFELIRRWLDSYRQEFLAGRSPVSAETMRALESCALHLDEMVRRCLNANTAKVAETTGAKDTTWSDIPNIAEERHFPHS